MRNRNTVYIKQNLQRGMGDTCYAHVLCSTHDLGVTDFEGIKGNRTGVMSAVSELLHRKLGGISGFPTSGCSSESSQMMLFVTEERCL